MTSDNIICALDIGTTKIIAIVAEMDDQGGIYVIGHGQSKAEGLRRGVVVDMDKTVKSIRRAIDDAQLVSGTEVDRVTVGIAGEHVRSINSHGVIAVSRTDNEIAATDVKRAVDAARTVAIPVDREIIHVIPQTYSVDDQSGIKDPVGMSGVRLEVEAHIVTASITSARNIYRALERCNLSVDHMVLELLAASQVLTNENETEIGVVVVDMGGDITNVSVFYDGAIRHTAVVPLGSRNITNDIAIGLRTSVEQAEQLKLTAGAALTALVDPEEMIAVRQMATGEEKDISRNVLASIIEPRAEEILSLVGREIKKINHGELLTAGMIITGGGANLPGLVQLAEQMFNMPVRVGTISGVDHIPDELVGPPYSTCLGLVSYGFANEPTSLSSSGGVKSFFKRIENWISKQL